MRPFVRPFVLVLAVLLAVAACSNVSNIRTGRPPAEPDVLTVMTFNIRMGYGTKDRHLDAYELRGRLDTLAPIVAAVRAVNPDVVALQEVAAQGQARRLAEALNYNFAHTAHGSDADGVWWGLAVLSKYPIAAAWTEHLSRFGGPTASSARSLLLCRVDFGGWSTTFVNLHRDHREGGDESMQTILRTVKPIAGPLLLFGDFNLNPRDRRLALLGPRFVDPVEALGRRIDTTFPSISGARIDYVLVDPAQFTILDVGLTPASTWDASDHTGFYVRLKRRTP